VGRTIEWGAGAGATTEFELLYRANVDTVTAYFARRAAEPQVVADLIADTFVATITFLGSFDPRKGTVDRRYGPRLGDREREGHPGPRHPRGGGRDNQDRQHEVDIRAAGNVPLPEHLAAEVVLAHDRQAAAIKGQLVKGAQLGTASHWPVIDRGNWPVSA
jgi:hypothetical protein